MTIFYLPDLGEGLAEAEIRTWYVKVGDQVIVDQPLAAMETAKALVDVPSPYAGTIVKLHGKMGEVVPTGAPLVTFEIAGQAPVDQGSVVGALEKSEKKWEEGTPFTAKRPMVRAVKVKILPAARALATAMQVDLNRVQPTGPDGLITLDDVRRLITGAAQASSQAPLFEGPKEALHGTRRVMAQAMRESHQWVVPATIFDDANMTHLPAEADLTVALIQAIVFAAQSEPSLNAWFDGASLVRRLFEDIHVGIAVDSPEGLFVPVLHHAQQASGSEIRQSINRLKQAIATRSLSPAEMQGSTITLSNFGVFAGRYATPIIIPPTVAIIACGRIRHVPVVNQGNLIVGRMLPLSLTFDHRAVTGGEAARFLGSMIRYLESGDRRH
jgi:pyruvate dehydrogenase E2 component (dihydrolipoamide acetyltransferase)